MFRRTVSPLGAPGLGASLLLGLVGCNPVVPCGGSDAGVCPAGMFCKAAACVSADVAGVCAPMPDACIQVFSPVCGCDGTTYGNPCMADAAGVNVARRGSCDASACCDPTTMPGAGGNPTCFEGVTCCGDGRWRCNDGAGVATCDTAGSECTEVCGGLAGIACADAGMFCKMNVAECCCDFQGVCVPRPEACIEIFDPVCGCDGMTYSNECVAAAAGVSIDHTGECVN